MCCTGPLTICSIKNLLVACSDRISWPLSPIMHCIWLHIAILLGQAIPAKNLSKVLITCRSHQSIANSSEYPHLSICGVVGIGRTYRKARAGRMFVCDTTIHEPFDLWFMLRPKPNRDSKDRAAHRQMANGLPATN